MKNITNLDIKRQRAGLTKELTAFAVVGIYKKASMKTKLELIGLIETLKHREKNYYEALDLIFKLEKVKDISGIISKLSKQKLDAKAVLLTLGRGGMSLFTDEGMSHVDIVGEEEVTDVTGAGDTVMATFCLGIAADIGMENAMRLANCAAGVTVNKSGAATCTPDELSYAAELADMELC